MTSVRLRAARWIVPAVLVAGAAGLVAWKLAGRGVGPKPSSWVLDLAKSESVLERENSDVKKEFVRSLQVRGRAAAEKALAPRS